MRILLFIYKLANYIILYKRLLQRYQNVKAELEAQQNLERVRMEKLAQSTIIVLSSYIY